MKIGILKEHKSGEKRVAIVPSTVSALSKKGYEIPVISAHIKYKISFTHGEKILLKIRSQPIQVWD